MPALPRLQRPLSDERVVLREAAERDIPEILIAHQDDPRLYIHLGSARPPSGAELGRLAEHAVADRDAGARMSLTILKPGSDVCAGRIEVHRVDWDHARAELGIWLAPQVRGAGLAPRALRLAAGWLFESCRLERVELLSDPANGPMLAAARAAGFAEEGLLRSYKLERGMRVEKVMLSLLPADLERR